MNIQFPAPATPVAQLPTKFTQSLYSYRAQVLDIHDGDTVTLSVDVGFGWRFTEKFRLYGPDADAPMGMNCPELNTPAGKAARQFLFDIIAEYGRDILLRTVKDRKEKYGRYLGVLFTEQGAININQLLVNAGHAVLRKY